MEYFYCKVQTNRMKLYFLATIVQLQVFFVTINAEEINLIQSIKTEVSTSMSSLSTWNIEHTSWNSSNVIDNKATGDPNTCGCCAGTAGTESPWLQIDLGSVYSIIKIQITGRSGSPEQYQSIYVYVSNTSISNSNGSLIYTGNTTTGTRFKIYQHPPSSFRYLFIRRFYKSFLTICEVELFEPGIDILDHIRDKALTFQSNIFGGNINNASYGPYKAIDNKANYSIDTCKCCSVTTDGPSWWQIDLRKRYSVNRLLIFGRSDLNHSNQLVGANVFAGNTSLEQDGRLQKPIFTVPNITTSTQFDHWLDEPVTAQFFIIKLNTLLTLCEFILYGTECSNGSYGQLCSERCHCADNMSCNFWTGKCQTPGCLPGWTGSACNKGVINILDHIRHDVVTSQSSYFNSNNISYGSYNAIDGKADYAIETCQCCSVTKEGNSWWQVDLRKQYLISRLDIFGRNDLVHNTQLQGAAVYAGNTSLINVVNANQKIYTVPNITTSTHFEIHLSEPLTAQFFIMKRNALLTLCEFIVYGKVCTSGFYGNECKNSFGNCANDQICNNVNGPCIGGCIDGFVYNSTDKTCKTPCDAMHFGKGCNKTCHCKSGVPCENGNGECPNAECETGWTSRACDKPCSSGKYGDGCTGTCGNCAKGQSCNHVNGTCSEGCLDGYTLMDVLCKLPCKSGFYGHNCSRSCGHCAMGPKCNISNGFCLHGCRDGFDGNLCETKCKNSKFGPNCANLCHCSNNSQCDIFHGNCSKDCDIGWAGFNCSLDLNILRRNTTLATALQSMMYNTCSADRAIDGTIAPVNPSNDADLCAACSVAQNDNSVQFSWWQLDLGSMFLVKFIKIVGRSNIVTQSQSITGYINNISMEGNQTGTVLPINSSIGHVFLKNFMEPRLFQYLKIQKQGNVLTLCEVKVYEAECPAGIFGDKCSNPCKCADKLNCDKGKGTCVSEGCLPGWEGASCNKSCGHQHFGPDCKYQCYCFSNGSCAKDSGICNNSRCDPGWELSNCSKVCDHRRFGINCSSVCNCRDNTSCNATSGQCNTGLCDTGWLGNSCNKVCDHRRFGINCSTVCNCRDNTSCNAITGHCKTGLCDPGWLGNSCDKVCDYRRFGINCSSVCNCRDNTSCNAITGHCKTGLCDPGWLGNSCDKGGNLIERIKYQVSTQMSSEAQSTNSTFAVDGQLGPDPDKCHCCSITYNAPLSWWLLDLGKRYPLKSILIYGRNKEDSYQQLTGFKLLLLNNTVDDRPDIFLSNKFLHTVGVNSYEQLLHNALARYIKIERPGVLTLCEVIVIEGNCRDGTFGEECVQDCHCADNKPCQIIHGYCQSPICKLGWMGKSCNESCTKNTFGEECKQVCYCEEGSCTSDYGVCPGKCIYGYRGVHCNIEGKEAAKEADHSSAAVIGGSVAGGVVVIGILLLLIVLIYKRRLQRGKRNGSENYYKTVHRNMAQAEDETTYDTIDISHDNQDQQNEEDNASVTGL